MIIQENLNEIKANIAASCEKAGRKAEDVTILAVTKTIDAERINEAFSDGFGDVILECTDEGYSIIDDYREEIGEWLLSLTK